MQKHISKMLAVAVVTLLVAACGSDGTETAAPSDNTESVAESPAIDTNLEAFCDATVGAESAVLAASEGAPGEDVEALMDESESTAPDAISEELGEVLTAARAALRSRDMKALRSKEFQQADQAVDRYVADNCESKKLSVPGADYAFEGLPAVVPAGRVTIDFPNVGEELHELLLMRINEPGVSVDDLLAIPEKKAEKKVSFVRALFALPGESDVETMDLEPGEYAVLCFIPVGATSMKAARSAEGPPHALEGMAAQLTVES